MPKSARIPVSGSVRREAEGSGEQDCEAEHLDAVEVLIHGCESARSRVGSGRKRCSKGPGS
jgi:hypothetical protein